jgi:hypothetical protein
MLNMPFVRFRFRGKVRRLFDIYLSFMDNGGTAMHPMEVSRMANCSMQEAAARLADTPELFVRLPKRADGLTRYRLSSQLAGKSPEDVEALLKRHARQETLILYALGAMLILLMIIALFLAGPALG